MGIFMANRVENLLWVQGNSPEKLKENLRAIEHPYEIVPGSWFHDGRLKHGVWIMCDRPAKQVSRKKPVTKTIIKNEAIK
jgi:hypothetical protein